VANPFKFCWIDKKKQGVNAEEKEVLEKAGIDPVQLHACKAVLPFDYVTRTKLFFGFA
jgi:hypothetical protein